MQRVIVNEVGIGNWLNLRVKVNIVIIQYCLSQLRELQMFKELLILSLYYTIVLTFALFSCFYFYSLSFDISVSVVHLCYLCSTY
jgi:hypothetical protein